MANIPNGGAPALAHYSDTTARTFEAALGSLKKKLPEHHDGLARLLENGRIDDVDAILAVLDGREP